MIRWMTEQPKREPFAPAANLRTVPSERPPQPSLSNVWAESKAAFRAARFKAAEEARARRDAGEPEPPLSLFARVVVIVVVTPIVGFLIFALVLFVVRDIATLIARLILRGIKSAFPSA